ncbi:MAG: FGGY-family carbohydrate kinase [Terriglobia bacterium]
MSLLGVDVGTTGCKAGAFSVRGEMLGTAYREYPTLRPRAGWAELDSRQVMACVGETIAEVASCTTEDPVTALCVSTMGEALTPVSRNREILGTCILSSDERGAEYLQELARHLGQEDFYQINPNILGPQYSLPKLLWLREHEPELYAKADKFLLWGEMVGFMLGCEPLTSYSLANRTLLFDIRKEDWSDRLLVLAGIEREKLPKPVPSGTIAGTVSDKVAAELNLPRGVAVVVGGHDQCCNSLGAGIYQAGRAVCGIGTFECVTPTYDRIPDATPMLRQGLNVEHHLLPGLYVSFLYNQGGTLVRWFRDTFAATDSRLVQADEDIYDVLAREMPAGPTRLLTLPYFEITGPPGFLADVSGVMVGLKTSTTRGEILKSIMECETMYFVDSIQALKAMDMDTTEFVATGGGAKSDQWLQIKADIFGVPFVRPRVIEASLLGAAILAGISTGILQSPAEAVSRFVERVKVFEPDPARHQLYQEKLADYRALFPLLQDYLARLEKRERKRAARAILG